MFWLMVYEGIQSIMMVMAANMHLAFFPECEYSAHFLPFI